LVNAVVALGLVAVVAAVALVFQPPAPPGIAEFAPQATKPITTAPKGQTSEFGSGGAGECLQGQNCAGPSPVPAPRVTTAAGAVASPKGVPSALQCYRWPDGSVTQTFDPQSPPCIASWPDAEKGNGGATSPGVTATTVRLIVPWEETYTGGKGGRGRPDLGIVNFLNSHYQLWGRKIELVTGDRYFLKTPEDQSSFGKEAKELNAFAATDFASIGLDLAQLYQILARERIIGIHGGIAISTTAEMARHAPYHWGYYPASDSLQRHSAELTCRLLKGGKAAHGGPGTNELTRKFAIVVNRGQDGLPTQSTRVLTDSLRACGLTAPVLELDPVSGGDSAGNMQALLRLKQDGYTTVFLFCNNVAFGNYASDASRVAYEPEWIATGFTDQASYSSAGSYRASTQSQHLFGIASADKLIAQGRRPWFQVAMSNTPNPPALGAEVEPFYEAAQLLAAGIQMAGPKLTPTTFERGLQSAQFPNPYAGAAPFYQAHAGYAADHAGIDDVALWWWDPTLTNPGGSQRGYFCYVGRGTRYRLGAWPSSDPGLFDPAKGC
jgi:hypothetical protein